jgi:NADPH:quinone reductase-like Zn-dependent oxidoreductase
MERKGSNEMGQWWTVPGDVGGVLELRHVPIPRPGPGQSLIKIAGAGVNRGELIARSALRLDNPSARPRPSGIECAGEIVAVGEDVLNFAVGDRVMARGSGCHAEYALIDAEALMAIPEGLTYEEAATIPNVFVTAHDALVSNARVQRDETVLITAGSSGVGTAAIQIAALLGAGCLITTTRRADKSERLRELGASQVIDTSQQGWEASVRDVCESGIDVVIDQVGGDIFPGLLRSMAVAGRYISVGRNAGAQTGLDLDLLARNRLTLQGVTFRTRSAAEALACTQAFATDMLDAFATGALRPVLDHAFPLGQLPRAHEYMLSNEQIGKIVLEV